MADFGCRFCDSDKFCDLASEMFLRRCVLTLASKFFPFNLLCNDSYFAFVSFQETEADLNESEEYKEAQNILDSVKLEV